MSAAGTGRPSTWPTARSSAERSFSWSMNCCGFVEQNSAMELSGKHLVVGMTGGIAAYKVLRARAPAAGRGRDRPGGDDRGRAAVCHGNDDAGAERPAGGNRPVGRERRRQRDAAHRARARGRRHRRRAGDRPLHGQGRARTGRRPADHARAGTGSRTHRAAGRAGDECRDVGEPGDAAQCGAAEGRWRRAAGPGRRARRPAARRVSAGCWSPANCSRTSSPSSSRRCSRASGCC